MVMLNAYVDLSIRPCTCLILRKLMFILIEEMYALIGDDAIFVIELGMSGLKCHAHIDSRIMS